ncbi:MAG: hypothetical protein QM784_11765 [Polyangiaceae bacterium]
MLPSKLSRISTGLVGLALLTCSSGQSRSANTTDLPISTLRAFISRHFSSAPSSPAKGSARVESVLLRDAACAERWQGEIDREIESNPVLKRSRAARDRLKSLHERASVFTDGAQTDGVGTDRAGTDGARTDAPVRDVTNGGGPAVLRSLTELRDDIDALSNIASQLGERQGQWPRGEAVHRRMKSEGGPQGCAERVPSDLESRVAQRLQTELDATGFFEARPPEVRPSEFLRDTKQLLDAIFGLDLFGVPTVAHCALSDSTDFEWEPSALDAVSATLESWRPKERLNPLDLVSKGQSDAVRDIAAALPRAVCEKLQRITCRDLSAARRGQAAVLDETTEANQAEGAKPQGPTPARLTMASRADGTTRGDDEGPKARSQTTHPLDWTAARARAHSLKRSLPALIRLRRAVADWGCSDADFGLDVVPRYAQALLDVAAWQLAVRTRVPPAAEPRGSSDGEREASDGAGASAASDAARWTSGARGARDGARVTRARRGETRSVELANLRVQRIEARVLDELRVYRREIATITFALAAPAVDALSMTSSTDERAIQAWLDLMRDLQGTPQGSSFGESGLFAYEQLRGLLLAEPKVRCPELVAPWAMRVFAEHDGLFFQRGRDLLDVLARDCVPGEAG